MAVEPLIPAELAPEHHHHRQHNDDDRSPSPSLRRSRSGSIPLVARTMSKAGSDTSSLRARFGLLGIARRTLGISLLLFTVLMWTVSNFLASYIFSDNTYSKPFFLVYVNTSMFAVSLVPMGIRYVAQTGISSLRTQTVDSGRRRDMESRGASNRRTRRRLTTTRLVRCW